MLRKKPDWLKVRIAQGGNVSNTNKILGALNTVCKSARCPNRNECFNLGTATFLLLGNVCTRNCGFCAVSKGVPNLFNKKEPVKIAEAVSLLKLKFSVITSVTRDDLPDGGAEAFSQTIKEIRQRISGCGVETLIPDFGGSMSSLVKVVKQRPDIIGHNLETVKSLYKQVRNKASYTMSLALINNIKKIDKTIRVKSSIMVGLGEKKSEVITLMNDLIKAGCDILTIGQYLQPTAKNLPVKKYIHPDEFNELKFIGENLGFFHVESGPMVRSSYHADKIANLV